MRPLARLAAALACLLVLATGALWASGYYLARPAPMAIGAPPARLGTAETVEIPTADGNAVRGWFTAGIPGQGAVLLLHGVRANRLSLVGRMAMLGCAGYSVLAIDLQAHGESPGERITFGALESLDAHAAVDYLRRRLPGTKVGAIGISLGGAAALLGPEPLPVDALVLESVFPDIETAIADRIEMQLGSEAAARAMAMVYAEMLSPFLGIDPSDLRPIDRIAGVKAPVLVISGTADRHTKIAETRALFAQARDPKELWEVEGAAHVNLQRYAGAAYDRRILEFLGRYVGPAGAGCTGPVARNEARN